MASQDHPYSSRPRNIGVQSDANGPPAHVRPAAQHGAATSARRGQSYAAKAAAARLAQVMASSSMQDDEDDDVQHTTTHRRLYSQDTSSARVPRFVSSSNSRDQSPRVRPATYNNHVELDGGSNLLPTPRPTNSARPGHQIGRVFSAPVVSLATLTTRSVKSEPHEVLRDVPLPSRRKWYDSTSSQPESGGNGGGLEEAALRDEIDLLQEDNEDLRNKLREFEDKLQEKETRTSQLEKQIAAFGEGISMEARLLSKKDAALRQREAALRAAMEQTKDVKDDEIAALRLEADSSRDEVIAATERASLAEKEVQGLRSVTRRMILTQDEMEEMVLKRCWLARYWGLASRHGVLAEVASLKHEHWSALAPLPLEVVISAGHSERNIAAGQRKAASIRDLNDITGEGNVECMLAVEKGLRELALLNVEQAVMLSIARHHNPSLGRTELSAEVVEDVQFKHAWLVYFWRRAKDFNVEQDIASERLDYWMKRSNQPPTSHDVVDVERGLLELHKLGVEEQLWEASRREVAHAPVNFDEES